MANIVGYTLGDNFDYFYDSTLASTNATSTTLIKSLLIPAGSMTATGVNTIFRIDAGVRKTGTANLASVYFYVNTSSSLTSATLLGTYNFGAASTLNFVFTRFGAIAASSSTVFLTAGTSTQSDYFGIGGASSDVNINWTVNQYIIFAGSVVNSADTIGAYFIKVSN